MADFFDLLLVIDYIDAWVSINKKVNIRFLEFVEWMISNQSNLKEIAQLV